jgi:hypothetical protein
MIKRRAKKSLHTKPEGKAKPGLVGKTEATRERVQRVGRGKPKPGHIVGHSSAAAKVKSSATITCYTPPRPPMGCMASTGSP